MRHLDIHNIGGLDWPDALIVLAYAVGLTLVVVAIAMSPVAH